MPIQDYSTDPDLNVQISGINIAEGCPPSGINNAIRQLMADVKEESEAKAEAITAAATQASSALEVYAEGQAAKDDEQDAKIDSFLDKAVLPLGFEYTRLTGETAPLGGVDYMGQTATRAMYADLWAWLQTNKPDAIVSESDWQALYSSQNGNVAKYSSGDGSTTFRFPRAVGYFKGAGSVEELGSYTPEGLPNIFSKIEIDRFGNAGASRDVTGAFYTGVGGSSGWCAADYQPETLTSVLNFDASRSNPIFGASDHVTPETVTIVMGVIAFGSVASIGEATEEGIVAELGEHGAKLGELEAAIEAFHDNCVGEIFPWPADSEPYRALPVLGAAVSRTTYAKLFAKIGTKYGAGDGSTTFNLPNADNRFIMGGSVSGVYIGAGLPNITGDISGVTDGTNSYPTTTWCFGSEQKGNAFQSGTNGYHLARSRIYFGAERSNSIYGNSDTVQPPALTMRYYIKY